MNKAKIVRNGFKLYLEVTGKPLDKAIYFEIEPYSVKDNVGKSVKLTKTFEIDLQSKEK